MPTNDVLVNATIDDIFILEHILQNSFDGKELTSLNGKTYEIKERRLVLNTNKKVWAEIISRDLFYSDQSNSKHFNRVMINNSLDPRFYIEMPELEGDNNDSNSPHRGKEVKIMRDPFEYSIYDLIFLG